MHAVIKSPSCDNFWDYDNNIVRYIMLKLKHHPLRIFPTISKTTLKNQISTSLLACPVFTSYQLQHCNTPQERYPKTFSSWWTKAVVIPQTPTPVKKKIVAILPENRKLILKLDGTLIGIIKSRHASHSMHFPDITKWRSFLFLMIILLTPISFFI